MPVSAITSLSLARLMAPISFPSTASTITSCYSNLPATTAPSKLDKAFVVGPGHAPIYAKLVAKTTGGHFIELADMLSANPQAMEQEPQAFLNGTLVASGPKRRQVEIHDILICTEAFTMFHSQAPYYISWNDSTAGPLVDADTVMYVATAMESTPKAIVPFSHPWVSVSILNLQQERATR